jgi:hypothetical protein
MEYLGKGAVIFDLFGSRDGESLAWLRSPLAKDKKILLLKGDNVDVKASVDVKNVERLSLSDLDKYDIIISSSPLYLSPDQEFYSSALVTDLLYQRFHWKKLIYLLMREASNFYYSRLRICMSQVIAKANMIYLIRESRHCGLSLALDSVRFYSIDIDIRSLSDYMILKAQGLSGLTKDLGWLYAYIEPHTLRKLKPDEFFLISRRGGIGYGVFPYHNWHKEEGEDILESVGIKVAYGEELHEAVDKGTFKTVDDKEHAEIIRLYIEADLGTAKIAQKLDRSSRTPVIHIQMHNESVGRSGFCPTCKRFNSPYQSTIAQRGVGNAAA